MAPYPIEELYGKFVAYAIYLLIGIGFGAVLEMAGFANSPKLAAQFYFKDMTVLKVMFTAIITAMVLIFLASGLGVLDYDAIWVNPTYLWPGIVGGLIMGIGFIIGGFCPGTSLVAVSVFKIDGLFFTLGAFFGIYLFGETVDLYPVFWNSSFHGRLTLQDWLGLPAGVVVLGVVLMALFMFWGGEQLERRIGKRDPRQDPKARYVGAALFIAVAALVLLIGQPTIDDKWERIAAEMQPLLDEDKVQIHPGELLKLMHDDSYNLVMVDVRDESDYNIFHIQDARRVEMHDLHMTALELQNLPLNTVIVTICNNEIRSTQAWKYLVAEKTPNVYILQGGINHWLDIFGNGKRQPAQNKSGDALEHNFHAALGANQAAAEPDINELDEIEFTPKVTLATKVKRQGGCG
ncbi:rhodanese-like domain-containing protein [candidate division KSB1 bacterium]|nr:rhodanese-like domain-containing protein [candidate division KSB1 bacterium]RQW01530.1 MAG: rhodanese-like domain-containing protein [candidate division KSB1 bacterium]